MNFYLYVFSSFSHFVETQCINITTVFSSGKIDICNAYKAKYVAVNQFIVCSISLKKRPVLTLCAIANCQEKKITLKKCVRPKIIITMFVINTKTDESNKLSKTENNTHTHTHTSKKQAIITTTQIQIMRYNTIK